MTALAREGQLGEVRFEGRTIGRGLAGCEKYLRVGRHLCQKLDHPNDFIFWLKDLTLQPRNAPAQFVYDIVEMTDCILEVINSSTQAYTSPLTGRLCPSILRRLGHGSTQQRPLDGTIRPSDDDCECYFLDDRSGAVIIITSLHRIEWIAQLLCCHCMRPSTSRYSSGGSLSASIRAINSI